MSTDIFLWIAFSIPKQANSYKNIIMITAIISPIHDCKLDIKIDWCNKSRREKQILIILALEIIERWEHPLRAKLPDITSQSSKTWNLSLRTKVMLIFLVLALGPLIIIGRFSLKLTEELIGSMVIRQLENVAADKVAILERWLEERKADLKLAAGASLLKTMDARTIGPYLDLMRKQYGVYKELAVVSADGKIVFNSREKKQITDNSGSKSYFVRKELFISDITYAHDEMESSFLIAAPIVADDGQFAGTVYGRVGTTKIIVYILNVSLGKTGECYLVDQDGRFLAHKEPRLILSKNISQSDSFRKIFEKRDSKESYLDYRGVEVLGVSLKIGGTNWYIVVEQDREEAFQSAANLKRVIYLTLLLCIASALMLTWMISYHMLSPIRKLSEYTDIIANSKVPKEMGEIHRRDEIGLLYRAVEDMSRKLQERQNHLEHKVGLREAELKKTDIILKKAQLMAERSEKYAAMGRMGAAVAHEIRTPLTSIKLFMESIRAEIGISDEDEEDFQIAMNQISRIEVTINRFLDFAKPQEPVFQTINIAKLIEDLLVMVRPQVNRQECFLAVAIDHDLPSITGDKKFLSEAFINLFVNSLESMPDHGTLTIIAAPDNFVANGKTAPCVRVDIGDTGLGIADHEIEKIFEPFYTTKATGTGLGLPLVLNTVKDHGGEIRVTSKIDEGTMFSLYFPLKPDQPLWESNGKNTTN